MEERDRFISSTKNMSDVEVENKLRPISFDEYVGQEKIKSNLKVFISAAKKRKEAGISVLAKAADVPDTPEAKRQAELAARIDSVFALSLQKEISAADMLRISPVIY